MTAGFASYAGVPPQIVFLNGSCQCIAGQIPVLIGLRRSFRNLFPIRRAGQNLRQQRIGVQRDPRNQLVQLRRSKAYRLRRRNHCQVYDGE